MTVPISILDKFKLLNYDKILSNIDNPEGKNKIILDTDTANAVSYTHLTLPTNREV